MPKASLAPTLVSWSLPGHSLSNDAYVDFNYVCFRRWRKCVLVLYLPDTEYCCGVWNHVSNLLLVGEEGTLAKAHPRSSVVQNWSHCIFVRPCSCHWKLTLFPPCSLPLLLTVLIKKNPARQELSSGMHCHANGAHSQLSVELRLPFWYHQSSPGRHFLWWW